MNTKILLIVNADDFGLARGVNEGVAAAFDRGIVRSASLLAGGDFAQDAAKIARDRPGLGVGLHLALTQLSPVLPANRLPGLTGGKKVLPASPRELITRLMTGKIPRDEIKSEFYAQFEKALDLGINITHLDGHQHLHLLPSVREVFKEVAEKYRIKKMRLPRLGGPARSPGEWIKALAVDANSRLARGAFAKMEHTDYFWGLAASGEMNRPRLLAIIRLLKPGTHELMTHPAAPDPSMHSTWKWNYHWEDELAALTDPEILALVKTRGINLGSYSVMP